MNLSQAEFDELTGEMTSPLDDGLKKLDYLTAQAEAFGAMSDDELAAGMDKLRGDRPDDVGKLLHGMECAALFHEASAARFRDLLARLETA